MKTRSQPQTLLYGQSNEPILTVLKSFSRPVWIILLGTFINRFGTFVVPFLALHLTRVGYSITQAGFAMMAYGGGHLLASIIGGHLADTIGRRNTIVISMFSSAVAMIVLLQIESLALFIVVAGLTGLATEIYRPASSAFLIDAVSPERRVTAFATFRFALNLGWAIGPATAGLLAKHSYTWLFIGDAATSIMFGTIALLALPQLRKGQRAGWHSVFGAFPAIRKSCAIAFGNFRFVQASAAMFLIGMVFMQIPTTFGLEVKAAGYDESSYGALLALNGVIIILFEIWISGFTRKHEPRKIIAFGCGMIGCGFVFFAISDAMWSLVTGVVIFTFGEMITLPIIMAYISYMAPDDMRGRFMGVFGLNWALALMYGPALGMFLFSKNAEMFWALCVIVGLLAMGLMRLKNARVPIPLKLNLNDQVP